MRHISAILTTLCLAVAPTPVLAQGAQPDPAELAREATGLIKGFATQMLKELQDAVQSGGPVNAVNVCNSSAPKIAREASEKSGGWKIGRTALKIRSPGNAPDAFEQKVLEDFAAKAAAGTDPTTLAHGEIVTEGGKKNFRFVKAIALGEPCLACHGGELKPEVKDVLAKHYPKDTATGFKVGELRGAFTLSKPLP